MDIAAPPIQSAVTFLFTDIEDSTRLWEHYPEAMREDLARHDALLHQVIKARGGHVFKTIGDAFCAAFSTAPQAVQASIEAQQVLQHEVPQLRVRMAVHTGEAVDRDGDYFGPSLNRVSRLLTAGHGGQVLLSHATVEQLQDRLPQDTHLQAMGEHRLRDLACKERIYQLLPPGLPTHFPPLNTLDVAFRRGLMRAALIAGVVIALVTSLAVAAALQAHRADHNRRIADRRAQEMMRLTQILRANLRESNQLFNALLTLDRKPSVRAGSRNAERRRADAPGEGAPDYDAIIKFSHTILEQAIQDRASEIWVDPRAEDMTIAFLVNGAIHEVMKLPKAVHEQLVVRYKVMSGLDVEAHRPEHGRTGVSYKGKNYDIDVSSHPTSFGEKIVIRLRAAE